MTVVCIHIVQVGTEDRALIASEKQTNLVPRLARSCIEQTQFERTLTRAF